MKKILVLSLFICFVAINASIPSSGLYADAQKTINIGSDIKYHYFAEPSSIAVNSEKTAVLDADKIKFFDAERNYLNEIPAPESCSEIKFYGSALYALTPQGIYRDGKVFIKGEYADFCLSENLLYAAKESQIYVYMIDNPSSSPTVYNLENEISSVRYKEIEAIAVKNTTLYFSLPGHINKNFSDVYCFDTLNKTVDLVYRQQKKIYSMLYEESLYAQVNSGIVRFEETLGELIEFTVYENDNLIDFGILDETVYALDLLGSIKSVDIFGTERTLIASASDAEGFYNMPLSVHTKNQSIIVSDFFNDRIAVTSDDSVRYIANVSNPIGAVVDNNENYYVANGINKVSVFDSRFNPIKTVTVPSRIKNISADCFNRIFVVADNSLYLIGNDSAEIKTDLFINNIYCNTNTGRTYLSTTDGIYVLTYDQDKWQTELFSDTVADIFAIDDEDQLFVLENNEITAYLKDKTNSVKLTEGSRYMCLSTVKNKYTDYGDMLVINPITHSLMNIPYSELGSVSLAHTFRMPDFNAPNPNEDLSTPMIRILQNDTKLYSAPYDSDIKTTLSKGQRIIVDYSLSSESYSFILFSDTVSKKLIYGYVFTESISPLNYSYSQPSLEESVVYNDNTPIYKYPSVFSSTLYKAHKNEKIRLLDFAALDKDGFVTEGFFLDDLDYKWFRIQFEDGKEGFIIASDLTNNEIKPQDIYPQINGRIIEYDGKNSAQIYMYNEQTKTYVSLQENIKAGTRIEILDLPFDPTNKYCRILYYKDGVGTVECYVLSNYVKYNSKNSAQYVALIIIVCCVILGICTFLMLKYTKKRRTLK